ncbi:MAG: hypothetical protein KDD43_17080, partial [Bdellovibrionales bacterium]|nr:hypothetical protein [Bdellovibrionales bacterium]
MAATQDVSPFQFQPGRSDGPFGQVPILVSSPHSGILFPDQIKPHFLPEVISHPMDTDFYIDELYGFLPEM